MRFPWACTAHHSLQIYVDQSSYIIVVDAILIIVHSIHLIYLPINNCLWAFHLLSFVQLDIWCICMQKFITTGWNLRPFTKTMDGNRRFDEDKVVSIFCSIDRALWGCINLTFRVVVLEQNRRIILPFSIDLIQLKRTLSKSCCFLIYPR